MTRKTSVTIAVAGAGLGFQRSSILLGAVTTAIGAALSLPSFVVASATCVRIAPTPAKPS